ncbi:RagB/SusD family nutrient uptake outer membrane protein [Chitinophaga sp. MM2321]|uniref:RagB/SusD family nutrient uptake outer membrane protein n=1 Tax=Chitinophaga sp. MM2321 TaxID=3137178 RepID=UPI0032D5AEB5
MKKINMLKAAGAIIFLLICSACSKDLLNKNPLDKVSSETFWKSDVDVQMAVAGCYDRLRGGGFGGSSLNYQRGYLDGLSDVGYVYWGLLSISDMSIGNISTSSEAVSIVYNSCYKGIASCNFFLDNVDKATSVSAAKMNQYKGEIKFLRALWYFDLVNCFGGVPLYKTAPESADAAKVAKSSAADVFKFIEEDLDFAISNLQDEAYTDGHAVKGSAMALKTRVLLYQEKWEAAATLAKQIMTSGKFSISNDYRDLFLKAGQKNNPEIMFSCKYLSPDAHSTYGMNIEYTAHVFYRQNFMDAFECIDGKSIKESPLYNAADPFSKRDPRFYYTIRLPGQDWPGFYTYATFNPTGVQNRKYIDTSIEGNYANAYRNDWDFVLLRYADVVLMYAEAQNEASGPDASIYSAINEVRSRPGVNMPSIDQSKYKTKELVRDYIRHEREIEFPIEGIRYFDLKRWHIAHTLLPTIKDAGGNFLVFDQRQYLWPFPQSELDNNDKLEQNPGY